MRFIIRILVIFFVISAVLSVIRAAFQKAQPAARRPRRQAEAEPQRVASSHLVKDPVCGTYVPQDTAIAYKDAFFCSEECKGKYRG